MFKNFFKNPIEQDKKNNRMVPSYIKPDGTKVYEQENEYGTVVYEVCPNHTYISRTYTKSGQLVCEYARKNNLELARNYDEADRIVAQIDVVYDEHNVEAMRTESTFTYYDNGVKASETIKEQPSGLTKVSNFDETGKPVERYEIRGTVKTWFDENNKPIKREIDRGSGGIITEDLRGKS